MTPTTGAVLVIALAVVIANLPFINQRLFGLVRMPFTATHGIKPLWVRLIELALGYVVVGLAARWIEGYLGSIAPQGWQFYAVTLCLFLVAAYPGYVWRCLRRGARR
ncbi:MAG TPA: DUF2818 family protein [Burkholderiaceae bacterium]|nr:DUF2818 family protein [Burkholderiaceae bacterium]